MEAEAGRIVRALLRPSKVDGLDHGIKNRDGGDFRGARCRDGSGWYKLDRWSQV